MIFLIGNYLTLHIIVNSIPLLNSGVSPALTPNNVPSEPIEWGAIPKLYRSSTMPNSPRNQSPVRNLPPRLKYPDKEKASTPASSFDECSVLPDHQALLEVK